ncbi:hypothetical protein ABW19_dt0204503 [Dactylella cylindrospora]|nr:hypothetical protein ABW19_dt0204503 [Dactylella cylindrospora]
MYLGKAMMEAWGCAKPNVPKKRTTQNFKTVAPFRYYYYNFSLLSKLLVYFETYGQCRDFFSIKEKVIGRTKVRVREKKIKQILRGSSILSQKEKKSLVGDEMSSFPSPTLLSVSDKSEGGGQ